MQHAHSADRRCLTHAFLIVLLLWFLCSSLAAQRASVTEAGPNLLIFATATGNVVASVGPDGALLIGTPSVSATPQISSILDGRTKSSARYVVVFPQNPASSEGDAGWGRRGALVAMQENALRRIGGDVMGRPLPVSPRFLKLGVDRPRIAFDHVLAFDLNGDAIHVVHQPAGYSDADAIAHFHAEDLVYLGEVFPGDGYPEIDPSQGGKLDGLLKTLGAWTGNSMRVVPARGPIASGAQVESFRNMIVTVRDRVQRMIAAGKTEPEILDAHPTVEFDAQWGHGHVSPQSFVQTIYVALKRPS